jgi:hypothetical protein
VESSCECGDGPSGSMKCWKTIECLHDWWPHKYCSAAKCSLYHSLWHRVKWTICESNLSTISTLFGVRTEDSGVKPDRNP